MSKIRRQKPRRHVQAAGEDDGDDLAPTPQGRTPTAGAAQTIQINAFKGFAFSLPTPSPSSTASAAASASSSTDTPGFIAEGWGTARSRSKSRAKGKQSAAAPTASAAPVIALGGGAPKTAASMGVTLAQALAALDNSDDNGMELAAPAVSTVRTGGSSQNGARGAAMNTLNAKMPEQSIAAAAAVAAAAGVDAGAAVAAAAADPSLAHLPKHIAAQVALKRALKGAAAEKKANKRERKQQKRDKFSSLMLPGETSKFAAKKRMKHDDPVDTLKLTKFKTRDELDAEAKQQREQTAKALAAQPGLATLGAALRAELDTATAHTANPNANKAAPTAHVRRETAATGKAIYQNVLQNAAYQSNPFAALQMHLTQTAAANSEAAQAAAAAAAEDQRRQRHTRNAAVDAALANDMSDF